MKRPVLLAGVALVAGFAAAFAWKQGKRAEAPKMKVPTGLSTARESQVRRFWETYRRATQLQQQGAWKKAAAAYREVLAINPRKEDALYSLGNVLFELGRYEEAARAWRRLVEVNPQSARAYTRLGALYSCGAPGAPFDPDTAEREFRQVLALNPEETGPILNLGEVCVLKGENREALTYFTTATRTNSRSVEANYLIGYLRWRAGHRAAALEAFQRAARFCREGKDQTKGASQSDFFAPYWERLGTWKKGSVSLRRMEAEYRLLHGGLVRLVGRRTKSARETR